MALTTFMGQPVGKRLLHLRVLATRDVDAGFEGVAVTAESGKPRARDCPLIVNFALSARQRPTRSSAAARAALTSSSEVSA